MRPSRRTGSWPQQRLDRVARVHRAVAVGRVVEPELQVEHLAGADLAVPDEVDELGQKAPDRAVRVDLGRAGELDAHAATGAGDEPGLCHVVDARSAPGLQGGA